MNMPSQDQRPHPHSNSRPPSFGEWFHRLHDAKVAAAVEVSQTWRDLRARYGSLDAAPIVLLYAAEQSAHARHVLPIWTELPAAAAPSTGADVHFLLDELEAANGGRLGQAETPEHVLFKTLRCVLAQLSIGPLPRGWSGEEEPADTMAEWIDHANALWAEEHASADRAISLAKAEGRDLIAAEDEAQDKTWPISEAHEARLPDMRITTPQTARRALAWADCDRAGDETAAMLRAAVDAYLASLAAGA